MSTLVEQKHERKQWWRWSLLGCLLCLAVPAIAYGSLLLSRPARTPLVRRPFAGIEYRRQVRHAPHALMLHIVRIDLRVPGVALTVTPQTSSVVGRPFAAQTTSAYLRSSSVQLAINGSFFFPFRSDSPWNYYPHPGQSVRAIGQNIADGTEVVPPRTDWGVLCIGSDRRARIVRTACEPGTLQALAGRDILLADGQPVDPIQQDDLHRPYPRTMVAIDDRGETLWLVLADGRQPGYSDGATLAELTAIARELGADAALNLDGGGSTTLVMADGWRPRVLNSPIHTRIPGRERPVANHLGIYAPPLRSRP